MSESNGTIVSKTVRTRVAHMPMEFHSCSSVRTFSVAGPSKWNSLLVDLRLIANMRQYKRSLKTRFLIRAYGNTKSSTAFGTRYYTDLQNDYQTNAAKAENLAFQDTC